MSGSNNTEKYIIFTGDYVGDDLIMWREGSAGYTSNLGAAGRYTLEEATSILSSAKTNTFICPESEVMNSVCTVVRNLSKVTHFSKPTKHKPKIKI